MNRSILFFCGQPLASTPIGQRVGAFGAYLRKQGWNVALSSVDPRFQDAPFIDRDEARQQDVEILGPSHYRVLSNGERQQLSPQQYLAECRKMVERIRDRAGRMSADIIVLSTTLPATLYAAWALPKKPYQVWMDTDDWSAGQFTAGGGSQIVGTVYGLIERTLPRLVHRITVCSEDLHGLFPKSALVPNFIRLDKIPLRTTGQQPQRVAFASGVTAYHGHMPLLEALARRRDAVAGLDFQIMGDGDRLDTCKEFVAKNGLENIVHFTGRLDRPRMLAALQESPVAVLPLWDTRLNRARFPLKMLDYLACGCAIVASKAGMAKEVLTHGETALLSEPGNMDALLDDVLKLSNDTALRERLSSHGMQLVKQYDEEAVCAQWMSVLENG